jgi:DNA polymerase epsilon subunit 2
MLVFIADIPMDSDASIKRLSQLFMGFETALSCDDAGPSLLFILIGDFFTSPLHAASIGFAPLKRLLERFARLARASEFVFVPGPNDPGPAFAACRVLPRPALPSALLRPLDACVLRLSTVTNPYRCDAST